jgi:opacity protein-like surface antigen
MRKFFITTIILLFFSLFATGQNKFSLTYSVGFPTGETSDYFGSTSWRGTNLDYHYFVKENLAIGFSTGWQIFYDDLGYRTETNGTETLSGFRYNYLNSYPILITSSYFFNPTKNFSPYVSIGVGLVYNELKQDAGQFRLESNGWPFSVRPELGMDYEIGYNLAFRTALRYNYVASGDELPSLSYIALNLGLVWTN